MRSIEIASVLWLTVEISPSAPRQSAICWSTRQLYRVSHILIPTLKISPSANSGADGEMGPAPNIRASLRDIVIAKHGRLGRRNLNETHVRRDEKDQNRSGRWKYKLISSKNASLCEVEQLRLIFVVNRYGFLYHSRPKRRSSFPALATSFFDLHHEKIREL